MRSSNDNKHVEVSRNEPQPDCSLSSKVVMPPLLSSDTAQTQGSLSQIILGVMKYHFTLSNSERTSVAIKM